MDLSDVKDSLETKDISFFFDDRFGWYSTVDNVFGIVDKPIWESDLEKIDRIRVKTKKDYICFGDKECFRTDYVLHMSNIGYEQAYLTKTEDDEGETAKLLIFKRGDLYFIICPLIKLDDEIDPYIIKENKRGLTI